MVSFIIYALIYCIVTFTIYNLSTTSKSIWVRKGMVVLVFPILPLAHLISCVLMGWEDYIDGVTEDYIHALRILMK